MPGHVTLDLAMKIVQPTQNIWAVFPGLGRRYINDFLSHSAVFLDFPAIALTGRALANDETLRQHIAMSRAWRLYLRGRETKVPSSSASDYVSEKDASTAAGVGNIRGLFARAKRGDLVIVGRSDLYDTVIIGEIETDFEPSDTIKIDIYGEQGIPIRKVTWLNTSTQRRFLSRELSRLLSSRKAVVAVDKNRFGEQIFRAAYRDYVSDNLSRYVFAGPTYSNIATATIPGIDLITYFCAGFAASEMESLHDFVSLEIKVAINKYYDSDMLNSFEIDFKSPGDYTLYAKRASMAAVVALLVSATAGDITLPQAREATLVDSKTESSTEGGALGACPLPIEEKYRDIMNSINADRYNELCQMNKKAQAGVGLTVGVKKQVSP